jgi:hypothetical protein
VLWNYLFRIQSDFGKVSSPVTNPQMDPNSKKEFCTNLVLEYLFTYFLKVDMYGAPTVGHV